MHPPLSSSGMPARRRGRRSVAGAALGVLALTAALSTSTATAASAADGGQFLKVYAPEDQSTAGPRDRTEALADARNYDVITAKAGSYDGHVAAMRAANPDLLLLVYINGMFAQRDQGSKYPESWYARDSAGRKITSRNYGNYLMDPQSDGWVQERISFCNSQMQRSGYSGCMVDMLGTAPTMSSYVSSLPVNRATGRAWTPTDWQRATTSVASRLDAGTSGALWGNGYGSASRYFGTEGGGASRVLSSGVSGALSEIWMRTANQSLTSYPTEERWRECVDQLVDLGRSGERTVAMVKLWASGTTAQKDAYHRFALATFLLGSNGTSSFHASYVEGQVMLDHPYWRADVGQPTGAYSSGNGVYQRSFTQGRVLVNPTDQSRTVALGGTYTGLDGARRTSITLPPHSGDVLRLG